MRCIGDALCAEGLVAVLGRPYTVKKFLLHFKKKCPEQGWLLYRKSMNFIMQWKSFHEVLLCAGVSDLLL